MRLAVLFLALLGLLVAQGNDCPHKKAATLLPSFTVTTGSTANPTTTRPTTTAHGNVTVHPTSNHTATSPGPTTATHGNVTVHPTSNHTATSPGPTTATQNPATTTTHRNITVHPITSSSSSPGPLPPSPSPSPGSKGAIGNYTWTNGSQPCVQLQAQIQIRVLYPTQGGEEAWGTSVLNPNKTKVQGHCGGAHPHLILSFPNGQLTFGFKQDLEQSHRVVYLSYMAVEYNVSFPQATEWTFLAENSSLRDLQAPLGWSYNCKNSSIALSPAVHLDLLSLRLQAAQLPHTGVFGPSFFCPSDQSFFLPLIIGLVLLCLLALVLIAFCISRRRPSTYQPL